MLKYALQNGPVGKITNAKITWKSGEKPTCIFKDASGTAVKTEALKDMMFNDLLEWWKERGFTPEYKYVAPLADPPLTFQVDGKTYKMFHTIAYHTTARAKAKEMGGELYAFENKQENTNVLAELRKQFGRGHWSHIWTSAYVDDGMWWFGNEQSNRSVIRNIVGEYPWARLNPKSGKGLNCAVMNAEGLLENVECGTHTAHVLLEMPPSSEGDVKKEEL